MYGSVHLRYARQQQRAYPSNPSTHPPSHRPSLTGPALCLNLLVDLPPPHHLPKRKPLKHNHNSPLGVLYPSDPPSPCHPPLQGDSHAVDARPLFSRWNVASSLGLKAGSGTCHAWCVVERTGRRAPQRQNAGAPMSWTSGVARNWIARLEQIGLDGCSVATVW